MHLPTRLLLLFGWLWIALTGPATAQDTSYGDSLIHAYFEDQVRRIETGWLEEVQRVEDWEQARPTALSFHMMRLSARWAPGNPFAEVTQAQQVLFNKHVGRVEIEVRTAGGNGVQIAVTDTGIGIGPADLERVMEPFAQVDTSFARKYEGTGLGLPLVKSLVELHGGELRIDSGPGRGTHIQIHVPDTVDRT